MELISSDEGKGIGESQRRQGKQRNSRFRGGAAFLQVTGRKLLPDSALPGSDIRRRSRLAEPHVPGAVESRRKLAGGLERSDRRIRSTLEKREENMYTGSTIEELINSVERAERHAREEEQQAHMAALPWMQQDKWQEVIEVA
jgi:hypothetical protein